MLSMMAASTRKRFSAKRSIAVKNMSNSGASSHPCRRPCPTSNFSEHSPSPNLTHASMPSCNWRMTASILGGTPKRARTAHRRIRSTESYALVRSIKHKYKGVSFFRPSSCRRRTTINRRSLGSKPTLLLPQNVFALAVSLTKATRDDFEEYFAGVSHKGDATIVATLRPIFLLVYSTLIVASFHCCGTPPPLHTATMTSWEFPSVSDSLSSAKTFRNAAGSISNPDPNPHA